MSVNLLMDQPFPLLMEIRTLNASDCAVQAHQLIQLGYLLDGTCLHQIKERQSVLVKGALFVVPPNIEHFIVPIGTNDLKMVLFDFKPFCTNDDSNDLSLMNNHIDFAYIQPLLSIQDELLPGVNITPTGQWMIEGIIDMIQRELSEQQEGYRLLVRAEFMKLLGIAGRELCNYGRRIQLSEQVGRNRKVVYQAAEYIEKHYQSVIRLEHLAEKSHIAPNYFSHLFKMLKGTNFKRYLNHVRIRKAMELLKETDLNIIEVCYQVGYNNVGHFNKMFKKETHVTPSEYRCMVMEKRDGV